MMPGGRRKSALSVAYSLNRLHCAREVLTLQVTWLYCEDSLDSHVEQRALWITLGIAL